MGRTIDADALKDALDYIDYEQHQYDLTMEAIDSAPTIDERILDKIRTEIKAMFPPSGSWMYEEGHEVEHTVCEVLADVLKIIDKYRAESEE